MLVVSGTVLTTSDVVEAGAVDVTTATEADFEVPAAKLGGPAVEELLSRDMLG